MNAERPLGTYNVFIIIVIIFFILSTFTAVYGAINLLDKKTEIKSVIPTYQSGQREFYIQLPVKNMNISVITVVTLRNITGEGIYQNNPVELKVTLTLQNDGMLTYDNGTTEIPEGWIYIGSFMVTPINSIEVSSFSNSSEPDRFSSIWCIPNEPLQSRNNIYHQTFSGSQQVKLQDNGLLKLSVECWIRPSDAIRENMDLWNVFVDNSGFTSDFKQEVDIPISIISELNANQQILQEQINRQQENNERMNLSLALFVFALASLDIGVAFWNHAKNKDKEKENEKRKAQRKQHKILEQLEKDGTLI
jgi:hypothetical protein